MKNKNKNKRVLAITEGCGGAEVSVQAMREEGLDDVGIHVAIRNPTLLAGVRAGSGGMRGYQT